MTDPDPETGLPDASGAFGVQADEQAPPDRYERGPLLGTGGMGRVYEAEDRMLRRPVALKVAREGLDPERAARLVREARIMATLDHPGIVPVYDAGEGADGQPFYTMRVVRGRSLGEAMDEAADLPSRLRLLRPLLRACEAIAYAHHAGVVHRDLKPANVLLGPFGETQVMDWGLARPIDGDDPAWDAVLTDAAPSTQVGTVLGTPAYMSPEQASGEPVGAATDVWALGAMLYEVVAGRRAYPGASSREVLARILTGPPEPLGEVVPECPPELGAIAHRALQPQVADRYPDAGAMAADLEAFLDGRRVSAHAYSARDELARAARTWRVPLIAFASALAVLLVVGAVSIVRIDAERRALRATQGDLEQALDASAVARARGQIRQALDARTLGRVRESQDLALAALTEFDDPDARGLLMDWAAHPRRLSSLPVEACPHAGLTHLGLACAGQDGLRVVHPEEGARWVTRVALDGLLVQPWSDEVAGLGSGVHHIGSLATDGQPPRPMAALDFESQIGTSSVPGALVTYSGEVRLITFPDRSRSREVASCAASPGSSSTGRYTLRAHLLAPDRLALFCDEGRLLVGPLDKPALMATRGEQRDAFSYAVDATQRRLAVGEMHGTVWVVDLDTGRTLLDLAVGRARIEQVALSADGTWVAARVTGAGLHVIEVRTGRTVRLPSGTRDMAFDPSGRLQVWTGEALELWELPRSGGHAPVAFDGVGVVGLTWTADGLGVATGNGYAWVDPATGEVNYAALPHSGVKASVPTPDGTLWVTSLDALYAVPDRGRGVPRPTTERRPRSRRLLPVAGDRLLATGLPTRVLDPATGAEVWTDPSFLSTEAQVAPGGRHAVVRSGEGQLLHFTFDRAVTVEPLGTQTTHALAVADGGWPVYLGHRGGVDTLDPEGRRAPLAPLPAGVVDLAVSPDGRWLAAADPDRVVHLLRADDGAPVARLRGHERRVAALAFSPDGRWLASGSWDDTVRFWDLSLLDEAPEALARRLAAIRSRPVVTGSSPSGEASGG